jgi:sugar phosphate isomerase/epimerase
VPTLKSELDIYWVTKGGADASSVWRQWESRIPLLHVKDGDLSDANVFSAVGDGKVPVAKTLTAAAESRTLEYLVVELDSCPTDMMAAVEKSLGWLVKNGFGEKKTQTPH